MRSGQAARGGRNTVTACMRPISTATGAGTRRTSGRTGIARYTDAAGTGGVSRSGESSSTLATASGEVRSLADTDDAAVVIMMTASSNVITRSATSPL